MKTVLVADDQPSMRLLVSATLGSDGVTVIQATDGDEAWKLIQEHQPDLALLDVHMPGRSGLELTEAIRSHPELAGMWVMLLTAGGLKSDIDAGMAAGANQYLTKPFSPLKLREEVHRLLEIHD
ncbi:MAG TPA: response regulator [Chloroflexota bacterium]|nr:response regulator [Chloroflexota bacterium]